MKRYLTQKTDLEAGVIEFETYRLDGQRHRDPNEGPAHVERDSEDGALSREYYYWHGRLHREGGPAKVEYNLGASIVIREFYYRHGLLHRDPKEGPAWIERDATSGLVYLESYYLNGEPYRDPTEGPRHIDRFDDGRIENEVYSDPGEVPPRSRPCRKRRGPAPTP